ncbi:uncharacterized protein C1orf127 homolog isoform X2 [Notamacropus eugenii]
MTEISTDDIECFSDYMALWIPKSHIHGLKQWLSRSLNVPVNWESMEWLNSFLARCGYFLHPDSAGNYIFQARYTACFVQQEKSNYLLEIRIFQKGVKSFGQSYILKCPVITSKVRQVSILCGPDAIQVSRPMPQGNASRQSSWLLSLRGELMASLEDASLLGLYVETNSTAISILGPRQQLLQRKEVMNTSVDFLSLWMVSGYFAYSLEAMCPMVSSQPGPEVLVQIPKQGLGLVKRGSRYAEALTLRDLRVSQSNSFMVTENRDYVVVSIPASAVLQSQQCQEGQGARRIQSFYRLDLSLEFAEVAGPVRWTVENFFHCADPSLSGVTDPESFSAEVSPSIKKHLSASHVPDTEELKSDLPSSLTILNTVPSPQPSSPALPPSTLSVGMQPASSFSLRAAGSASSEGLQKEPFGSFALDSGQRERAPGTKPVPCLQLNIFSNSPEKYSASTRSRSAFSLGCLIPSNPTAPSNSTSPTLGASTSAIVSFRESSGNPKNLQSKSATLTALLPGLWLHSPALNHDKRRPSGIPMTVPSNEGSPKSEKPPEATEKIPKDVSKAIASELSDADQEGQAFLQMSTTLAAGQDDSPRHPGSRRTNSVLSKNFSGGIIHPLFSFTTHSSKKEREFLMNPQAVSVGISQDFIISSVPGAMMNQQGTKNLTNEGIALLPPSVMFQDDPTPSSVTTGDHSQLTHPAPTTAGQHYSVPALPQLVSFGSTKFLGSLMHLQKVFTTQTDGLREIRPEQDLAQLSEHPNQLRKLMEGSRTETDVSPQLENGWVGAGLQGGNHLAGESLATTLTGRKADTHHGHNQTQEVAGLQGVLFPTSEITVANQRDSHFLQNRTKGILVADLLLSGPEEAGQPSLQTEPQSNSPLSWRDVAYTNRGTVLHNSFPEGIVPDSTVTYQEWPKTDGPTSPIGHMLKSQQAFGHASIHPFLLPRLLTKKQLSNPQRRTLEGIRRSTVASTEGDRKQLSRSFEGIRTQGPGSMAAGTGGWVITPTYSLWPSRTLHPESYLSQVTEAASSSISNPREPGDLFSTGY